MATDLLKDRVIPFFDEHRVSPQRVLTDVEHTGIVERFYRIVISEFYR